MPSTYIDPVIASRIRVAWAALPPDQRARISARLDMKRAAVAVSPVSVPQEVPLLQAVRAINGPTMPASAELTGLPVVDANGEIWGTGRYEHLDPGWAESIACWLETMRTPYAPFPTNAQVIQIPDTVKIAMAGDWGTGDWRSAANPAPSTKVAAQMAGVNPDVTIHLGDTYYAGTDDEVTHLFASLWPSGSLGALALNGNHEMYSGGWGFFMLALADPKFALQKGCSFFALENSNWVIVGLDSAYYSDPEGLYMDGTLRGNGYPDFQSEFLRKQVAKGKKVIVLTHHNAISEDGKTSMPLFEQVVGSDSAFINSPLGPEYWYYGHSHMGVVYRGDMMDVKCRCVGHGGVPWGQASVLANSNVLWYEKRSANDPEIPQRVLNGFAVLTLNGDTITEQFIDECGGVAWQST